MGKYIIISVLVMVIMVAIQILSLYLYRIKQDPGFEFKNWYKNGLHTAFTKTKKTKNKTVKVRYDELIKL